MLKSILSAVLLRKKTISTLLLMILLLGAISYVTFPQEEMPEINTKRVALIIKYEGMSSDDIEKLITEPLERDLLSCLLYTSPSPRDRTRSRMPSSA